MESESVSSFKTDFDVDCTFEEYMCSNSQLHCSPVLSSAHIIASLGEITEDAEDMMMMQVTLFPMLLSIKLIMVS